MTTATLERPAKPRPIDTLAGAIHRKCRCIRCRVHAAEFRRDIYAQKAAGTWQPFVDAAPVRAHVEALHTAGMSYRHISRLSGVEIDVLARLRGRSKHEEPSQQIRTENARRLLAVQPNFARSAPRERMPNRSALRRVQALRAIGWPVYALMAQSGLSHATFVSMPHHDLVELSTHRTIEALYELLHDQDPAEYGVDPVMVRRGQKYAASQKWAVPAAWADIDADEAPNRRVRRMGYQTVSSQRSNAEVVAEAAHLAGCGLTREQVVERLGMAWDSIAAAHGRAGVKVPLALQRRVALESAAADRSAAA